jgi:hypothetical protein
VTSDDIEDEMLYLNNCDGKDHAELYGENNAFFDLYIEDVQPKKLVPDQDCLVATRSKDGQITCSWFSFLRTSKNEFIDREGNVRKCKVFHGNKTKELGPYSQAEAVSVVPAFFTKNGEFKQWKFHEG